MANVDIKGGGDLMEQITAALNATEYEVLQSSKNASSVVAKETVKALKSSSPKNKGKYAKGWKSKAEDGGQVVYNETAPGLTHLLNNGHDVVKNGRVIGHFKGDNHIGKVESQMVNTFVNEIEKELNRRLGK